MVSRTHPSFGVNRFSRKLRGRGVSHDVPKKLPVGGAVFVECEENGGVIGGGFIRKRLVLISSRSRENNSFRTMRCFSRNGRAISSGEIAKSRVRIEFEPVWELPGK